MKLEPGHCGEFQQGQKSMIVVETTDQGAAAFTLQEKGSGPQRHHLEIDSQSNFTIHRWPVEVCNLKESQGPIVVSLD